MDKEKRKSGKRRVVAVRKEPREILGKKQPTNIVIQAKSNSPSDFVIFRDLFKSPTYPLSYSRSRDESHATST